MKKCFIILPPIFSIYRNEAIRIQETRSAENNLCNVYVDLNFIRDFEGRIESAGELPQQTFSNRRR